MHPHLDSLLSRLYDELLHPEHLADLRRSGISDETFARQKIRTVPPSMIEPLLGFDAPQVRHAYLIPFPDPRGGWMNHVRMKVFPSVATGRGTIKYLQPKRSGVRIFFPLATLNAVMHTTEPLYFVEGEKKALAVAQLGLPAVGMSGVEGWHVAGARDLHPDLDDVGQRGRLVRILPDGDVHTNPAIARAVYRLSAALERRGAVVQIALLPWELRL
jgi:hypothetical protein